MFMLQPWEESFIPTQLRGGFRASGIFLLAIPVSSFYPYLITRPFCCCCCQHNMSGLCYTNHMAQYWYCKCSIGPELRDCGHSVTPNRMHVVFFFIQHFQGETQKGKKDTGRLKPRFYGDVLTRDGIISRMEKDEVEKKKKEGDRNWINSSQNPTNKIF